MPGIYTRCQEKIENNKWPVVIGGFAANGLSVGNKGWGINVYGVAAARFFC
ncbi:hypothetical protein NEPTK9_000489 [Candidatus Neptunochlamydia vexilliferae]|uniref:Uncharacterized protein n=1 Tax=Candidatus Neptunichlamydia vexilliferae TaxID=1651774 RepID=A0ABS0AZT7_9BACT|nr:hypothetical protein [Candidatus Neptunochlamydia vexilliferae]